jgi:hypothetical protein
MAQATIIQGEDVTLAVKLNQTGGEEYPLSGVTELTVQFCAATGGTLDKTLSASGITIVSEDCGKFTVNLTDTDTEGLTLGEDQAIQIIIDKGAIRRKVYLEEMITVSAGLVC